MARCAGSKPDGTPCERIVSTSQTYCYAHDSRHRKARSLAASKAARSKPNKELQALKYQLQDIADRTLSGELESKRSAVAIQALNVKLRALEQERHWRELGEIEERLENLENARLQAGEESSSVWQA